MRDSSDNPFVVRARELGAIGEARANRPPSMHGGTFQRGVTVNNYGHPGAIIYQYGEPGNDARSRPAGTPGRLRAQEAKR